MRPLPQKVSASSGIIWKMNYWMNRWDPNLVAAIFFLRQKFDSRIWYLLVVSYLLCCEREKLFSFFFFFVCVESINCDPKILKHNLGVIVMELDDSSFKSRIHILTSKYKLLTPQRFPSKHLIVAWTSSSTFQNLSATHSPRKVNNNKKSIQLHSNI